MQNSKINPATTEQADSQDPSQPTLDDQVPNGESHPHASSSLGPAQEDEAPQEESKDLGRDEEDSLVAEPAQAQLANARSSSDRSNRDSNSSSTGERKDQMEGSRRSRHGASRASNPLILSAHTQQIIMEIIQTLRNNTSPDAAEQLFKTLTETSEAIEQSQKQPKDSDKEEEAKPEVEVGAEPESEVKEAPAPAMVNFEDQLKLLLEKLNSNSKLNQKSSKSPLSAQNEGLGPHSSGRRFPHGQTSNSQGGLAAGPAPSPGAPHSQLITQAYHLINSVIMYPQIMWTRNFFYSLGAMAPQQQQIMHDWFIEMNEKQQIYIKEIERANDQLKETAASMFSEKGFSREQTDLFLKKVNFMENREYFFHKRRSMASRANGKDGDRDDSRDSSAGEDQEKLRPKDSVPLDTKSKAFINQNQKVSKSDGTGKGFFDQLSSSCKLDDEQMRGILRQGPKGSSPGAPRERRPKNYERGINQASHGSTNPRAVYNQQNDSQRRYPHPRAAGRVAAQGEHHGGQRGGSRYFGSRGQGQYPGHH